MQGEFVGGSIEAQVARTFENIDRVLAGFGVTRSNIAEVVICLANLQEHLRLCAAITAPP